MTYFLIETIIQQCVSLIQYHMVNMTHFVDAWNTSIFKKESPCECRLWSRSQTPHTSSINDTLCIQISILGQNTVQSNRKTPAMWRQEILQKCPYQKRGHHIPHEQVCTNPWCQITHVTKFYTAVPSICWFLILSLFHVMPLAPTILRWLLDF